MSDDASSSHIPVVFLSGPYRAPTEYGVYLNIHQASEMAHQIWVMGAACICPHKNTAFFGGIAADEVWLEGDLEILSRCDAIVTMDEWQRSVGARGEVAKAKELGIPVLHGLTELRAWLESSRA